ncbi:CPBP family intramembrane metalloprotease [Leucobacter rhizosphaerae]|uniref:CPBP family intramembrane metalloprotease n=1 Tax=Leucobacter rhizosphaerae TaxID=2932245 RepID=A0ABY4FUX5_9MICO|nr:CPBP family intramembrane glutamic endopeptidase [Leucobacter rhizosphaerae]UOQ60108.1 CPBP family intramembrane metalloprotease [Leucobacter rhizosphaerae]
MTQGPDVTPTTEQGPEVTAADPAQHLAATQGPAAIPARVPWGAVALFVLLSFGLAWLVALPLWVLGPEHDAFPLLLGLIASAMMFTPTLAVLAVTFLLRVPATGSRLRFLGMWPLRPAKRVVWWTVAAIFAPAILVAASVGVAALFGWTTLDLVHFSGFAESLEGALPATGVALPPIGVLVAAQLAAIPLGAVINSVFAAGEEIGWRGWLVPALRPLGVWPSLLLSGAIWGLWHSPLILLGYNFGLTDWRGVALMTVGCTAWGVLFGWSRLRTGSVWPAVVGHGALNASASLVVIVAAAGAPVDPALVSPLGAAGWIVIAVVTAVLLLTGQFRREPALAPSRRAAPAA